MAKLSEALQNGQAVSAIADALRANRGRPWATLDAELPQILNFYLSPEGARSKFAGDEVNRLLSTPALRAILPPATIERLLDVYPPGKAPNISVLMPPAQPGDAARITSITSRARGAGPASQSPPKPQMFTLDKAMEGAGVPPPSRAAPYVPNVQPVAPGGDLLGRYAPPPGAPAGKPQAPVTYYNGDMFRPVIPPAGTGKVATGLPIPVKGQPDFDVNKYTTLPPPPWTPPPPPRNQNPVAGFPGVGNERIGFDATGTVRDVPSAAAPFHNQPISKPMAPPTKVKTYTAADVLAAQGGAGQSPNVAQERFDASQAAAQQRGLAEQQSGTASGAVPYPGRLTGNGFEDAQSIARYQADYARGRAAQERHIQQDAGSRSLYDVDVSAPFVNGQSQPVGKVPGGTPVGQQMPSDAPRPPPTTDNRRPSYFDTSVNAPKVWNPASATRPISAIINNGPDTTYDGPPVTLNSNGRAVGASGDGGTGGGAVLATPPEGRGGASNKGTYVGRPDIGANVASNPGGKTNF